MSALVQREDSKRFEGFAGQLYGALCADPKRFALTCPPALGRMGPVGGTTRVKIRPHNGKEVLLHVQTSGYLQQMIVVSHDRQCTMLSLARFVRDHGVPIKFS